MDGADEHRFLRRHRTKVSETLQPSPSHNDRHPSTETGMRLTRLQQRNLNNMPAAHLDADGDASSSLFIPHDDHYDNERAARRRRVEVEGLALPRMNSRPLRFPGDGLDYRRPVTSGVTSAAPASVIDLTDDDNAVSRGTGATTQVINPGGSDVLLNQRPPRFGRNIIDIASEEDLGEGENWQPTSYPRARRPQYSGLRRPTRPPSPPAEMDDIEFVAERPRSRRQTVSRQHTPAMPPGPRSFTPFPDNVDPIDLTNDDDVVHLNTRPRDGINVTRPGATGGVGTRSAADYGFGVGHVVEMLGNHAGGRLMQRLGAWAGYGGAIHTQEQILAQLRQQNRRHHHHHHHHHQHQYAPPMHMPNMMDYGAAAFDMGLPGVIVRPPSPKYSPPPEAEEGFTHSPQDDDVLVCPNCGDELALGETEEKQKVWVVKSCGHAYCGECAQNRLRSISKKGKGKASDEALPPAFKKCVVDGCAKSTSKNAMIPVFLGS